MALIDHSRRGGFRCGVPMANMCISTNQIKPSSSMCVAKFTGARSGGLEIGHTTFSV